MFNTYRDAIKIAEEAEKHILEAVSSSVMQVCFQLRLGRPIPIYPRPPPPSSSKHTTMTSN